MIVASSNGLVELSCDFSDPCLCTYHSDGAFSPEEIRAKYAHPKRASERLFGVRNRLTAVASSN